MDIMELGAIGELVGGVAVIASLIYVGLQVRQSNQISRAESVRSFVRDYNQLLYRLEANEESMRKGFANFGQLSNGEQTKIHWVLMSQFMLGLGDAIVHPNRTDPFAAWIDNSVAMTAGQSGFKEWWDHFKSMPKMLAPEYVKRIDALAIDAPDLVEMMPWFTFDDREDA